MVNKTSASTQRGHDWDNHQHEAPRRPGLGCRKPVPKIPVSNVTITFRAGLRPIERAPTAGRKRGWIDVNKRAARLPAQGVPSTRLPYLQRLLGAFFCHEPRAVVAIGFERVVRGAPQTQIVRRVRAALRPRLDVSKLNAAGFVAAVAVLADKTAASVVARPHVASRCGCDVTSASRGASWLPGGLAGSRLVGHADLALLHLGQECVERAIEERSGVTLSDLLGKQIFELFEFGARAFADGDGEFVAPRSEGLRGGVAPGWRRCGGQDRLSDGGAIRKRTQCGRNIALRRKMRHEHLNLSNSLVFGLLQYALVIFLCQVRFESVDAAQMDLTAADHFEQHREAVSGACGADALASGRLGHMVTGNEEIEHRWMSEPRPEFPLVDGIDVAEQIGFALTILPNQFTELAEQRVVVQSSERRIAGHGCS